MTTVINSYRGENENTFLSPSNVGNCPVCYRNYTTSDILFGSTSVPSNGITLNIKDLITVNGHFLDTQKIQHDISVVSVNVTKNVDLYKTALKRLIEQFKNKYLIAQIEKTSNLLSEISQMDKFITKKLKLLDYWHDNIESLCNEINDELDNYNMTKQNLRNIQSRVDDSNVFGIKKSINKQVTTTYGLGVKAIRLQRKLNDIEIRIKTLLSKLESQLRNFEAKTIHVVNQSNNKVEHFNLEKLFQDIRKLDASQSPFHSVINDFAKTIRENPINISLNSRRFKTLGEMSRKPFKNANVFGVITSDRDIQQASVPQPPSSSQPPTTEYTDSRSVYSSVSGANSIDSGATGATSRLNASDIYSTTTTHSPSLSNRTVIRQKLQPKRFGDTRRSPATSFYEDPLRRSTSSLNTIMEYNDGGDNGEYQVDPEHIQDATIERELRSVKQLKFENETIHELQDFAIYGILSRHTQPYVQQLFDKFNKFENQKSINKASEYVQSIKSHEIEKLIETYELTRSATENPSELFKLTYDIETRLKYMKKYFKPQYEEYKDRLTRLKKAIDHKRYYVMIGEVEEETDRLSKEWEDLKNAPLTDDEDGDDYNIYDPSTITDVTATISIDDASSMDTN